MFPRSPQSLLLRSFILISSLVMLTTASWLIVFRHGDAEPRARELAQMTTSGVNLVRAALFAVPPEKHADFLTELASREGIRLLPAEPDDEVTPPAKTRFFTLLDTYLKQQLGADTQVASAVNGVHGFWVSFRLEPEDEDSFWMIYPKDRIRHAMPFHLLSWGILALAMSLAVAGVIVNHITRPLRELAEAARQIGKQNALPLLPANGPIEVRQVNEAFNRMTDDLREYENERAEILAGISHDLRTPLSRLRLEVEMGCTDETTQQGMVADIEQMDSIIAQFLDYARSNDGETPSPCVLADVLEDIAEHASAIGRPLQLNIHTRQTKLAIALPVKALRRSLQNLLENAWKYGESAEGYSRVELCLKEEAQRYVLSVRDHGKGIPPNSGEQLKRAFMRANNARSNATGTGLGLAIVDRFARQQGGKLNLENHPEGGLIASIEIPKSDKTGHQSLRKSSTTA